MFPEDFIHFQPKLDNQESIQLTPRNPVIPHGKSTTNLEMAQNIARNPVIPHEKSTTNLKMVQNIARNTRVKIIEQPAARKLRFR